MLFDHDFHIQTPYRQVEEGRKLLPLDEKEIVIGLQGQGVEPVCCLTNGTKLKFAFYEDEMLPKYQLLSQSLVISSAEPFLVDYIKEVRANRNWNQELAMMRSMNRPRS
jgi:hypothetical protein